MTGEPEEGFRLLEVSAHRMVELRPAYAGPWFLAMAARCAPDATKAKGLLREGEEIFDQMTCVSHNYLHFYDLGIQRLLEDSNFDEAERYVSNLENYLKDREIPFGNLCVRRGRTLIETLKGDAGPGEAFQALKRECEELGLKTMSNFCERWEKDRL